MRVGLIDIEPKVVNTAYMQIAAYHRTQGDTVEWWTPLSDRLFHKVYCSSIFNFTNKKDVPGHAICGGTGFDITGRLPKGIESSDYDYSIYPDCDYSLLWFSRGCIRKCRFCVVPAKEGGIHAVTPRNLNPKGKYLLVQDNNFFASPQWQEAIAQLRSWDQPTDFHQGIDIRILTEEMCQALKSIRIKRFIRFSWDNPGDDLYGKFELLLKCFHPGKLFCYVLVGFNSTEDQDLYRVEILRRLGIEPFAMPYNKKDLYQRNFSRWVNRKWIFKSVSWRHYSFNPNFQKGKLHGQVQGQNRSKG